jgi:hypothetical protein
MPNSHTPHSVALRKAATARCNQRVVDQGGRRLGVLLPPESAAQLAALETARNQSARAVIIDLIRLEAERLTAL